MTLCRLRGTSSCLWESEQTLTIYKIGGLPRVFAETRLPGMGSRKKPATQNAGESNGKEHGKQQETVVIQRGGLSPANLAVSTNRQSLSQQNYLPAWTKLSAFRPDGRMPKLKTYTLY